VLRSALDRAIFITGAASGIGRETARLFARRGWGVGLHDVDEAGLHEVAREIGGGAPARRLNVCDIDEYRAAVRAFDERFGRMDVLFNCAGVMQMGTFESIPWSDHRRTIDVNVGGVLNGIHASLPLLKRTGGARIVTMSSASAIYGVPELATYSASKFFVRGLTEALNIELERDGIVVTDLMPLFVNTPLIAAQTRRAGVFETLGAGLEPHDVAELVFRAVQGRRTHWVPGAFLKTLNVLSRALPGLSRPLMRYLSRPRR